MSLRRTAAALLAASTLTLASPSRAQNPAGAMPWVLKPGEFYSELTGSVFAAKSGSPLRAVGSFRAGSEAKQELTAVEKIRVATKRLVVMVFTPFGLAPWRRRRRRCSVRESIPLP